MIFAWYINNKFLEEANLIISSDKSCMEQVFALNQMCKDDKGKTFDFMGSNKSFNKIALTDMILECENNPEYTKFRISTDIAGDESDIESEKGFMENIFKGICRDGDTNMLHDISSGLLGENMLEVFNNITKRARKYSSSYLPSLDEEFKRNAKKLADSTLVFLEPNEHTKAMIENIEKRLPTASEMHILMQKFTLENKFEGVKNLNYEEWVIQKEQDIKDGIACGSCGAEYDEENTCECDFRKENSCLKPIYCCNCLMYLQCKEIYYKQNK